MGASFLRNSLEAAGIAWDDSVPTPTVSLEREEEMMTAWRDIWSAGHGVGLIKDLPTVAELAQRLKAEYQQALLT